jgi:uncharacterized protein YdcH (DUF465 family)
MSIFKKKKNIVVYDDRTKIEKTFEEGGQKFGRKTGEFIQKGVNKIEEVKEKLESDGTMDKIRDASSKVDEKIDKVVNKVSKKTKEVVSKVKKTKVKPEDDFYE